ELAVQPGAERLTLFIERTRGSEDRHTFRPRLALEHRHSPEDVGAIFAEELWRLAPRQRLAGFSAERIAEHRPVLGEIIRAFRLGDRLEVDVLPPLVLREVIDQVTTGPPRGHHDVARSRVTTRARDRLPPVDRVASNGRGPGLLAPLDRVVDDAQAVDCETRQ